MIILIQIATALAIGAYVVLSKDSRPNRPDATPRESFQHPDNYLDRDGRPERTAIHDYNGRNRTIDRSRRPSEGPFRRCPLVRDLY